MSEKYVDLTGTSFPDLVDALRRMADLEVSDLPLVKQYYDLINAGNLSAAKEYLRSNPQIESKIFNADKMNTLIDAVIAVQRFFKDSVEGYIDNTEAYLMDYIDAFTDRGEYSPTTQYFKKNIIIFAGCGYVCKQDCMGQAPIYADHNTYWGLIARGIKGDSGLGLASRGNWNNYTTYRTNEWVSHENRIWQCMVDNVNSEPTLTNSNWESIISFLPDAGVMWQDLAGSTGESIENEATLSYTTNHRLIKPSSGSIVNIDNFNKNMDIIDSMLDAFPETLPASMITTDSNRRFVTDTQINAWNNAGGLIVQATAPAGNATKMWVNSSTGVGHFWNGSVWKPIKASYA